MSIKDAVKQIMGNELSVENQNMSANSHNLLNSSKFNGKYSDRSQRNDSIFGNRSPRIPETQRKDSDISSGSGDDTVLKKEKTYTERI
jgi:hypothetical protein